MPRRRKAPEPPPRREHGQGSVRFVEKRERWRARLPRQADGARRETWHPTRDEAEAWIARELARDTDSFDPTRPVGVYLNYWFRLRSAGWGPQTGRRYKYEAAALGSLSMIPHQRLRGDQVLAALAAMLDRKLTHRYAYTAARC